MACMELLKQPWMSIQLMPYKEFLDSIKWKMDLEEEKRKKMDEKNKDNKSNQRRNTVINRATERVNHGRSQGR